MGKHDFKKVMRAEEEVWQKLIGKAKGPSDNNAKGNSAENAWRKLLRDVLPTRYQVDAGYVISADNKISGQIDCVVYDNMYTPVFCREHDGEVGGAHIPAEAVYAVFEIKHREVFDARQITAAAKKIKSVRALRRTSVSYVAGGDDTRAKEERHIIGGLLTNVCNWEKAKAVLDKKSTARQEALDVVLTAENGGADYFDTGHPGVLCIDSPVGLMHGVIRLARALQKLGTVSAIDLDEWAACLIERDAPISLPKESKGR